MLIYDLHDYDTNRNNCRLSSVCSHRNHFVFSFSLWTVHNTNHSSSCDHWLGNSRLWVGTQGNTFHHPLRESLTTTKPATFWVFPIGDSASSNHKPRECVEFSLRLNFLTHIYVSVSFALECYRFCTFVCCQFICINKYDFVTKIYKTTTFFGPSHSGLIQVPLEIVRSEIHPQSPCCSPRPRIDGASKVRTNQYSWISFWRVNQECMHAKQSSQESFHYAMHSM